MDCSAPSLWNGTILTWKCRRMQCWMRAAHRLGNRNGTAQRTCRFVSYQTTRTRAWTRTRIQTRTRRLLVPILFVILSVPPPLSLLPPHHCHGTTTTTTTTPSLLLSLSCHHHHHHYYYYCMYTHTLIYSYFCYTLFHTTHCNTILYYKETRETCTYAQHILF